MRNHDAIVIGTGQSGSALALQDLVAGKIDLMFDNPITPLPYVRAGSIQSLAVTARHCFDWEIRSHVAFVLPSAALRSIRRRIGPDLICGSTILGSCRAK